jgi:RHS repeat-associated protein
VNPTPAQLSSSPPGRDRAPARLSRLTSFAILAAFLVAFGNSRVFAQEVDVHNPIGVTGIFNGNVTTGCSYDPLSHSSNRAIDDIVVPGSIGKYPLKMTRYYNSRHFVSGGTGPGWSYEYSWGLSVNGSRLTYPNGNVLDKWCQQPVGISDSWQTGPLCDGNGCDGDFRLADGGTVHFVNGRVTAIDDPYGQTTTIAYTATTMTVTEPGGRYLLFKYNGPQARLSSVEAHGLGNATVTDWVNYSYTLTSPGGTGASLYCLTGVAYSDGTSAAYTYTQDNVQAQYKVLPLLSTANDVRYHGPMRQIAYDYQGYPTPHGAITAERFSAGGTLVSRISPGATSCASFNCQMETDFTETRGDGPTRTFHYTDLTYHSNPQEPGCPEVWYPQPPSQFLESYTDFQGHTTTLGYDKGTNNEKWYVNSVTDAYNRTTTYTRGPAPPSGIGQITQIKHPDNTHVDYIYYAEGTGHISGHYLKQITDERGNVTFYGRDGDNRVTYIWYEDNQNNVIAGDWNGYNSFGQVTTNLLKNGAFESFVYDGLGLLTDKYNPKLDAIPGGSDPHTHYTYYTSGPWTDRVLTMALPANVNGLQARETYEYDKNASGSPVAGRGLITKITHGDSTYQSFGYDAYGNKLWEENELRQRTTYTYDAYNRVLTVKNPLNDTTTYTYKPTNGNGTNPYLHTTNNADTVTTPTGIVTTNDYDQNFRKTSSTVASSITRFGYDNVGNPTTVTDPLNHITTTDYDTRNRKWHVWDALNHRTTFGYDAASNVTRIDHPDGGWETKAYDALNRLGTHNVYKSASETLTTTFGYWPSGKLFWVKDPKQQGTSLVTYFAYDESDQRIAMYYPDPDLTTTQQWTYDDAHNLTSHTTVGGKTEQFAYDIRNRKDAMTAGILNPLTWIEWADYGYDAASRLTLAKNGTGVWNTNVISTVTRQYDAAGHLTSDQQNVTGLGAKNVTYPWYDDDGRLKRIFLAGGGYDFSFGYDGMGRFQFIFPTGNNNALFQYSYDAASNETQRYNWPNRVAQIYTRDALDRLTRVEIKNTNTNTTLGYENYGYDGMSRLNSVSREYGGQDQFGYYYDGELFWATYGTIRNVTYVFDKAGNRIGIGDSLLGNSVYTTNDFNQYTAVTSSIVHNGSEHEIDQYQTPYDAQPIDYTYLTDDQLVSVKTHDNSTTYLLAYDGLGRCVKRTLNGTTTYYIYDGEKPILEYTNGAVVTNLYGKGIDEILQRTDPSVNGGQAFYYQQDHEGSVTHLTNWNNGSGQIIERYRYDAFGSPVIYAPDWTRRTTTSYKNRFLFTGREYAASFGFYEYRARAYHPWLGRFMSEDPKLFDPGDYNLFRYCHNDPIDLTDPMGLETKLDPWYLHHQQAQAQDLRNAVKQALNTAYNKGMANAQRTMHGAHGGAIGVGRAAYQTWSAIKTNVTLWADAKVHYMNTPTVTKSDGMFGPVQVPALTRPTVDPNTISERGSDGTIGVSQRVAIDTRIGASATQQQRDLEMTNVRALVNWVNGRGTAEVNSAVARTQVHTSMEAERAAYNATVQGLRQFMAERAFQVDSPLGEHGQ